MTARSRVSGVRRRWAARCAALALLLAALVTTAVVVSGLGAPVRRERAVVTAAVAEPMPSRARTVLRRWDVRRSTAWARGDPDALRALYLAGSAAGRRDVAMLRAWQRRGVVVRNLRMQVLRVQVLTDTPRRIVLVVDERVVGAVADRVPGRAVALPHDGVDRHRIDLRRTASGWVVAGVSRRARSAAPP